MPLSQADILELYSHEYQSDPTHIRQILVAMNSIAMRGNNLVVGVKISDSDDQDEALRYLASVKGHTDDTEVDGTVRGLFKYIRPDGIEKEEFWFKAPYFIRNRIHTPETSTDIKIVERMLGRKAINLAMLYT